MFTPLLNRPLFSSNPFPSSPITPRADVWMPKARRFDVTVPARAWTAVCGHDLVGLQAGLQGSLLKFPVNDQVLIEKEISYDKDVKILESANRSSSCRISSGCIDYSMSMA